MVVLEQDQIVPAASLYEPPHLEVLGQLSDLADGRSNDGITLAVQVSF